MKKNIKNTMNHPTYSKSTFVKVKTVNKIFCSVLIMLTINIMGCSDRATKETNKSVFTELMVNTRSKINEPFDTSNIHESMKIVLENESLTIQKGGIYHISGSVENGQIIIDSTDSNEVVIVLSNISINCNYSAPIYVKEALEVVLVLEGDNVLSISSDITDSVDFLEGVDGVIYSKSDLIFEGTGTLSISSDYSHGIVGKDDIELISGSYYLEVDKDGIQANNSVSVVDSKISITSNEDGIQVENDENSDKGYVYLENSSIRLITVEDAINASNFVYIISGQYIIDSELDGIQADEFVYILDGTFNMTTGGGYQGVLNSITPGEGSLMVTSETDKLTKSMKAIKSNNVTIDQGEFVISSYEDAINAKNDLIINGGIFTISAGDDAITSKDTLVINDGTINIENGYEGLQAIYISIIGGDISINVLDDGINGREKRSLVTIAGGNIKIICQGDGLDSNGDMVISGGYIILDVILINPPHDGYIDISGTLRYDGGTIVDGTGTNIDLTEYTKGVWKGF